MIFSVASIDRNIHESNFTLSHFGNSPLFPKLYSLPKPLLYTTHSGSAYSSSVVVVTVMSPTPTFGG